MLCKCFHECAMSHKNIRVFDYMHALLCIDCGWAWFSIARVVTPNDFFKATPFLANPFGMVEYDNTTRWYDHDSLNAFIAFKAIWNYFLLFYYTAFCYYCNHWGHYWYVWLWQHLPLQLKFVLLLDFVQQFSHVDKLFSNLPFELDELLDLCCCCCSSCCWCGHTTVAFDDDDGVAFDVGVVAVAVATTVVVQASIGFVDSSSFNGSPFRLTTVISTSTPCNFDATDCNIAHKIQSIIDY